MWQGSLVAGITWCGIMVSAAHAEITIHEARYAGGVLVVRGETSQPNQRVTLDERYSEWTDRAKQFIFRIRYLPADCTATIRAGVESRPASIAGCEPTGALPLNKDSGAVSAHGAPQAPAGIQVVPLSAEAVHRGWRARELLGDRVLSKGNEELGRLRNIIIANDGGIKAVIVEGKASGKDAEFVYRIPWDLIDVRKVPGSMVANITADRVRQSGLFVSSNERAEVTPSEFPVTEVIGDYARLQAGQGYGYVSDVVFEADGRMLAVLVIRDAATGGGTYAFGFPGTTGPWNPAAGYYGLPYVTAEHANAAAVRVNPYYFESRQ